jgi:hypothetical protein
MEMIISTILTMEKGIEYIDTDQSFNESTPIERLKFLGKLLRIFFPSVLLVLMPLLFIVVEEINCIILITFIGKLNDLTEIKKNKFNREETMKILKLKPENNPSFEYHWYLGDTYSDDSFKQGILAFIYWNVIYCYLIPVSLFVTLEIIKFFSSILFSCDLQM